MTKKVIYADDVIDTIHKIILGFFDICGDEEETPMSEKDELLLEVNKAIATQIKALPSVQPEPTMGQLNENDQSTKDCISRQGAISLITGYNGVVDKSVAKRLIAQMPSAQPELPPYVAEIEAEYREALNNKMIHKPLAYALYQVWWKHEREDGEQNG